MGNTTTSTQSTQQATATPEEKVLLGQEAANNAFMQPIAQKTYSDLSSNIQAILEGQTPMAKGIGGIDESQTQSMVNSSLRDIMPQFQSNGILNSGEAAQVANRTAADVRNQNAQFNVSAAQNLFNLASGGQSNLASQYQNSQNAYGSQLAGLRSVSSSGSTTQNPFLNSFYNSAGGALGKTLGSVPGAALSAIPGGGAFSAAVA